MPAALSGFKNFPLPAIIDTAKNFWGICYFVKNHNVWTNIQFFFIKSFQKFFFSHYLTTLVLIFSSLFCINFMKKHHDFIKKVKGFFFSFKLLYNEMPAAFFCFKNFPLPAIIDTTKNKWFICNLIKNHNVGTDI